MSRKSERKLAQRHAHAVGLDRRRESGAAPLADAVRKTAADARKVHRPERAKPKPRPRWREQIGIGADVLERMVSELRRAKDKPARVTRIAIPCDCDPQRDHGPHWITPTEDEIAALKEAA